MSEAKWYVVHTYSGYENKVKANIDKTIENMRLSLKSAISLRVFLRMSISTAALFMRCLVFLWSFTHLFLPLRESLAGVPTGLRRLSA